MLFQTRMQYYPPPAGMMAKRTSRISRKRRLEKERLGYPFRNKIHFLLCIGHPNAKIIMIFGKSVF